MIFNAILVILGFYIRINWCFHHSTENNAELTAANARDLNFFQSWFGSSTSIRTCKCKCGVPNRREQRLVGGTDLRPYEFPWLAQVIVANITPIEATLINDRYVITSAITVIGFSPYDMKVSFGVYDKCYSDVTSSQYSVSSILIHPEFQYVSRQNDLALIRLSSYVPFQKRIAPVCLPTPETNYEHSVATIAAWIQGLTADNDSTSTCTPRKIELPIVSSDSCTTPLLDSQGCVGVVGSNSVLCKDDAGSAVLHSTSIGYYELVGVLSDQQSCHATSLPNEPLDEYDTYLPMYTKTTSHLKWILFNTRDGCYCNKI